jgi:hypothetical protein
VHDSPCFRCYRGSFFPLAVAIITEDEYKGRCDGFLICRKDHRTRRWWEEMRELQTPASWIFRFDTTLTRCQLRLKLSWLCAPPLFSHSVFRAKPTRARAAAINIRMELASRAGSDSELLHNCGFCARGKNLARQDCGRREICLRHTCADAVVSEFCTGQRAPEVVGPTNSTWLAVSHPL